MPPSESIEPASRPGLPRLRRGRVASPFRGAGVSGAGVVSWVLVPATLVLATLAGCGGAGDGEQPGASLAPVSVDVKVFDAITAFDEGRARILAQDEATPLWCTPAILEQGTQLAADGSRRIIRAHAESAFEVDLPPLRKGARLHVRTMVYTAFRNEPEKSDPAPVDFRVEVNGEQRFSLSSAYVRDTSAEHPFDQLMRSTWIDLPEAEGQSVTLTFETTRPGGPPPADTPLAEPIWWDLSVVQPVRVPRQGVSADRPHLLVVCVDTLAAGRTSLHGYGRATTPRLAELAARGTRFDLAVSPSSWTLPATASLLTGLPPNTHGVLGDKRSYLMEGLLTWPERLREEGLVGAAFVANPLVAEGNNFHQGFEHWDQQIDADADELTDSLLNWIDTQPRDARWFAYLHLMDPHAPYGAPGEARDRFVEPGDVAATEFRDFDVLLPHQVQSGSVVLTDAEKLHVVDLYDGEVAYLDAALGRLLDALAERGELERTTILVTADHGEELFEHDRLGHGYSLYEELVHVPLLMAGPGVPEGVRVRMPVGTAAVANTVLHLAGAPLAPQAALPLLPVTDVERRAERTFSLTRTHLFGPRRILVSCRDKSGLKVVCTLSDSGELVEVAGFLLADDPDEQRPLGDEDMARDPAFAVLRDAALDWYHETAAARPSEPQSVNDEMKELLEQIGYIGGKPPKEDADGPAEGG